MLVLTRRVGESVVIGEEIRVRVVAVKGNQVRLGIDAPRKIQVRRDEVEISAGEGAEMTPGASGSMAPAG